MELFCLIYKTNSDDEDNNSYSRFLYFYCADASFKSQLQLEQRNIRENA